MVKSNFNNSADNLSRRSVLHGLAGSFVALNAMNHFAYAEPKVTKAKGGGSAKSVIFINVLGGLSHVDSFDIKEANKDAIKASAPIKTSADGIRVGKYFPKIAKHMDKFAVINSMTNTQGAHREAQYLMRTGYERRGTVMHPNLGAWVSKLASNTSGSIPSYLKVGEIDSLGAGFFSSKYAALPIAEPSKGLQYIKRLSDLDKNAFERRLSLLDKVNKEFEKKVSHQSVAAYRQAYHDAVELMNSKDLEVFDLNKENKATHASYGEDTFGKSCLLARRLVEKGVRFVELSHKDWDDHYGIYTEFPERAPTFDQGLAALMEDLKQRGLLDTTLVVVATEFGRNPELNDRDGRNHFPSAYTCMLAGGGVKGGQLYGKTDKLGKEVIENKVKVVDFNATIAHAMGLPLDHVETSPEKRPFKIADHGKPITAIF